LSSTGQLFQSTNGSARTRKRIGVSPSSWYRASQSSSITATSADPNAARYGRLPDFIARRSGAVVNMASIAGRMIITPNGTYCASKHALVAWSEVLKHELHRFDVQVNVVCQGCVLTSFFDHETFRTRAARPETQRMTSVESVSRATLHAIRNDRFLTSVPGYLGAVAWLTNALPWLVKPIYARLLSQRIGELYIPGRPSGMSDGDR
jgi:short-subunit dehydrogenase